MRRVTVVAVTGSPPVAALASGPIRGPADRERDIMSRTVSMLQLLAFLSVVTGVLLIVTGTA